MKSLIVSLLLLPALAALPLATADAQQRNCHDRNRLIDALVSDYGEQLAEVHEVKGGSLLEFHVSPNNGSWTALLTDRDEDRSCVLASGDGLDPDKLPSLRDDLEI